MKPYLVLALCAPIAACTVLLDFNDVEDLPCPCDQDHVCLVASDHCVKRGSVENYKSCDLGAERPDDLCSQASVCESVNGQGLRCLPKCKVSNYGTPAASARISLECAAGYTCWETQRSTGVCSEGICSVSTQNCPIGQKCVSFNAAGVCFTTCDVFANNPCAGDQVCQPVGESDVSACLPAGLANIGDACDDLDLCMQQSGFNPICDKPLQTGDLGQKCLVACACPVQQGCQSGGYCNTSQVCSQTAHPGLGVCQ